MLRFVFGNGEPAAIAAPEVVQPKRGRADSALCAGPPCILEIPCEDQAVAPVRRHLGADVVGHDGGDYGTATEMFLDEASGVGVIVLANVDWSGRTTPPLGEISDRLYFEGLSR